MTKYDTDFHAWTMEQAEALQRRSANQLDWDNLAEELLSLGRSEENELKSRYTVLLTHLLKWKFQPAHRSRSWASTIKVQRRDLARHFRRNPSLQSVEAEEYSDAYELARLNASAETGLDVERFPPEPPFTPEQAKADDWWPDETQPS